MRTCPILFLCLSIFATTSIFADDESEDFVPGFWLLAGMTVNGEAMEDDDLGKRIIVFTEQGTMAAFEDEDALKSFEPDDVGRYELGEDNTISFYVDRNENEKMDDHERKKAETMAWSMDEGKLVLSVTIQKGEEKVVYRTILEPYKADQ